MTAIKPRRIFHGTPFIVVSMLGEGCAATATQVLVLRECLAIFYGSELTVGVVLFFWLVWTGLGSLVAGRVLSGLLREKPRRSNLLGVLVSLYGVLIPATLLWIRASRGIYGLPLGEMVSFDRLVLMTALMTAPVCGLFGVFFGSAWALYALAGDTDPTHAPYRLYACEGLGATLGGVWLYVFLFFRGPLLYGAVFLGALLTLLGVGRLMAGRGRNPLWRFLVTVTAAAAVCGLGLLEEPSRRWQWGSQVVAVNDTPYRNLALRRDGIQESLMADGLWLFTYPDPQSAEEAVHLTLLQHSWPQRILMLGAVSPEELVEACRYTSVERIDVVDPDMTVQLFAELQRKHPEKNFGQESRLEVLFQDPHWTLNVPWSHLFDGEGCRVSLIKADMRRYVESTRRSYDVVFLNAGDPISLGTNRFYTQEFFHSLVSVLRPGGLVSFHVSGAEDMLGAAQATYFRAMVLTFQSVFPHWVVYPGARLRVVGSLQAHALTEDYRVLTGRLVAHRINPVYVRPDRLENLLDPVRLAYFRSLAFSETAIRWNRDLDPVGFLAATAVWATLFFGGVNNLVEPLFDSPISRQVGIVGVCATTLVFAAIGLLRRSFMAPLAVAVAVGSMGAAQMAFQILLLFLYQVAAGALYAHLTVLVTACMAGLSAGALIVHRYQGALERVFGTFLAVHGLTAVALSVVAWLSGEFSALSGIWPLWRVLAVCAALACFGGMAGGAHFALGCLVAERVGWSSSVVGGFLYGADMLGAAVAAAVTPLILVPAFGVQTVFYLYAFFLFFVLGFSALGLRQV